MREKQRHALTGQPLGVSDEPELKDRSGAVRLFSWVFPQNNRGLPHEYTIRLSYYEYDRTVLTLWLGLHFVPIFRPHFLDAGMNSFLRR